MTLELLEKIFLNTKMHLTLEEATEKGRLFFDCALTHFTVKVLQENFEDYWLQLSKEWDLNICEGEDDYQLCLYRVKRDRNNCIVTDTLDQFISI